MCPIERRREAWKRLETELDRAKLAAMTREIALSEVPEAAASVFGGQSQFSYKMWKTPAPVQTSGRRRPAEATPNRGGAGGLQGGGGGPTRWRARFDAKYQDIDLARYTDFLETKGLRVAGRASANLLEWPLGHFSSGLHGEGSADLRPGGDVEVQGPVLTPAQIEAAEARGLDVGPFNPSRGVGYVPFAGHLSYTFSPEWITLTDSWVASPSTYASFAGRTAWLQNATIPFHVTSNDWQRAIT
jgi:hypothetical protein